MSVTGLVHIASAQSKTFVEQVFVRVYQTRLDGINDSLLESVASQLSIDKVKSKDLLESVLHVSKLAVFYNFESPENVAKLFPLDFKKEIVTLVSEIVAKYVPKWRDQTSVTQISLPKLVEMKWRIDIRQASNVTSRLGSSNVIVQMKVQEPCEKKGVMAPMENIDFELNKETLEVMLKGLGKIREQLSSIK